MTEDITTPRLTSEYLEKSAIFYTEQRAPLLVLVEDKDDIPFWTRMFACVREHYLEVNVCTLKMSSQDAMTQTDSEGNVLTATGKDALMQVSDLGKHKVVAVDADYDLLSEYHTYSQRFRRDKYVVHTEYYAIENHLLDPTFIPNLSIWRSVVGPYVQTPDWKSICEFLGGAIMPSVKLVAASYDRREKAYRANPLDENLPARLTIEDVNSAFSPQQKAPLDNWKRSLTDAACEIESQYKSVCETCSQEFQAYNHWTWLDALHYVQGHILYDCLAKVIEYYYLQAYKAFEKVKLANVPNSEKKNEVSILKAQQGAFEDLLHDSVYSADALDMSNPAILTIQSHIMHIL